MWKGGKRKLRTKSTSRFAVSRVNLARNGLGVCPAHQKTDTPSFKPGVPVFEYAELIPNVSEALRLAGRAPMTKTYGHRGGRDRAPALRPSAFGCSHCATTSFLPSPSLSRRRASLRSVGDPCAAPSLDFPLFPDRPRHPARQRPPARTTDNSTATTRRRRPSAHPFKLEALGETSLTVFGWLWARGTSVGWHETGKSLFSMLDFLPPFLPPLAAIQCDSWPYTPPTHCIDRYTAPLRLPRSRAPRPYQRERERAAPHGMPPPPPRNISNTAEDVYLMSESPLEKFLVMDLTGRTQHGLPVPGRPPDAFRPPPAPIPTLPDYDLTSEPSTEAPVRYSHHAGPRYIWYVSILLYFRFCFVLYISFCISAPTRIRRGVLVLPEIYIYCFKGP